MLTFVKVTKNLKVGKFYTHCRMCLQETQNRIRNGTDRWLDGQTDGHMMTASIPR